MCATAALPALGAQQSIDEFFDSFLMKWVRSDPSGSTALRILPADEQERLDAKLTDATEEYAHARVARARSGLATLKTFDRSKLTREQQFSADMLQYLLDDIVAGEPYMRLSFPLNQMMGLQVRLPTLLTDLHPIRSRRDAENYIARLQAFGGNLDQGTAAMRDRDRQGIRPPGFILVETINQMKRFVSPEPARSILVTSLSQRLEKVPGIDPAARAAFTQQAESLVRDSVYPAYRRAMDQLATQSPKATEDAGISRLPNGAEAYAFYLRRFTTTNMTSDQIHQTGLNEVKRIQAEMEELLKRLGKTEGPLEDRLTKIQTDSRYPDGPDVRAAVLADYAKIIQDANRRSQAAFDRVPKANCIVQRIPEFQEANAAANYQPPPPDGSRPGIFRVPLRGPYFPKMMMRSLAYHEAIPGHHFQLALQVETPSLPKFRRSSPFGAMSAFSEGWGLYAERLAADLGWYQGDEVGNLGRLASELFRARRLVVDTELHMQHWTRQQAIDYGIPQSEVDRYVVMPGQACSYKIGQLKILELRDKARKELGSKFTMQQFHNIVLNNGSIPLTLLQREVDRWIAGQKA